MGAFIMSHLKTDIAFFNLWSDWVLSDALGLLLTAPLFLTWAGGGGAAWRSVIALYVAWDKPELTRPYVQTRLDAARRVAEAPGANADNLNYVAYLVLTAPLSDLRDVAVALPFAKRAVAISEGRNADYLHNLARCHFLLGDLVQALDFQRRAASLLPTDDENNPSIIRQRLAEYEAAAEEKDGS